MSELLFSCRYAFPAPVEQLDQALRALAPWPAGSVEATTSARGAGSQVAIKLFGEHLPRHQLDTFSRQTYELFAALEARLGLLPENVRPDVWPDVHASPGTAPHVLRRADFQWKPFSYTDAPEELMGSYVPLTALLGVTQFGADIHRLAPGERNCRSHAEVNEQEGFLVLSGTCHIEVEGTVIALGAGDLCVTMPGEEHFLFNASDGPCEVLGFGGPDLVGSGASYPRGKDVGWHERVTSKIAATT